MGQYYIVANIDKRQYVSPWDLDCGAKLMEWSYQRNSLVTALFNLMSNEWKGDRVYVVGDYADLEDYDADDNWQPTYKKIAEELGFLGEIADKDNQYITEGYPITLFGYAKANFEDIGEYVLENELDKNLKRPIRYIFNNALKCTIDLADLPATYEDYNPWEGCFYRMYVSPLSLLLAMGNGRGGGDYHSEFPGFDLVGSWVETSEHIEFGEYDSYRYEKFQPAFTEQRTNKNLKVINLLEVLSENSNIVLIDEAGNTLAEYDGKNSIDEKFNRHVVKQLTTEMINQKIYVAAVVKEDF